MNLDLLKKLIKLANHNPNEHEANSAARRACKLLEDFKFQEPSSTGFLPNSRTTGFGTTVVIKTPQRYTREEKEYDAEIDKMYDDLFNRMKPK
jgi:hypothetical protein